MDPVQQNPVQDSRFTQTVHTETSSTASDIKKYLLIGLGLFILILFWVWVNNPMILTVTGLGSVSVPATNSTVSFTLSANDGSVQSAVASVQSKAATVRNYLISKGVAEGDIAQSQVTAVPSGLVTQGASGFQATISMSAKTTHVSDVSTLITDLYTNGALIVTQPVLSIDNEYTLSQQALNDAMVDADKQAAAIGFKKWKFIRKIVSVTQASSGSTSTSSSRADTLTEANNQTAAINGVFKIARAVSVSYKLW